MADFLKITIWVSQSGERFVNDSILAFLLPDTLRRSLKLINQSTIYCPINQLYCIINRQTNNNKLIHCS